ncbi:Hsp20/alpha crystallin family protein, partial [Candidatus Saccharibacteria bacterium]|nr:Hsp20/alpha crystallin family protein [Candidatus Saccharibacteria bacterium]
MARKSRDDDLLMEDELTAAFLGDDDFAVIEETQTTTAAPAADPAAADDAWDEEETLPGQLAVDVYETKERLFVKGRVAGVNKADLDVSISDNTLSIRGTLTAGADDGVENYFV